MTPRALERLALGALLNTTFGALHPLMDHWAQRGEDARLKGLHGRQLVHADGTPATGEESRPTMTASACGRRAAARHVAGYTLGQVAGTVAVTRALGYRVPPGRHRSRLGRNDPAADRNDRPAGAGHRRGPSAS
ncbi:hypothetical protein ACFV5N_00800 [Streptomyces sp. NPDC059853]|uniref:hypothetical protein n=1 Tax=Streptomyces sp. NPDC059853 TaxID=3346973 RepID=UPI0036486AFC